MQLFEVFIPSQSPDGLDITARVRAESWTAALKQGLTRLGDTTDVKHIMCDIQPEAIAVTEPKSGRVFRIREVPEEGAATEAAATPPPAAKAATPPAPPPAAAPPAAPSSSASSGSALSGSAVSAKAASSPSAKTVSASPAPGNAAPIGRGKESATRTIDDLLGDTFMAVGKIYELKSLKSAADFILELAMKAVAVESGRVVVSSINNTDLAFAAARGPKAEVLKDMHIPVGQGIVGFAVQEGVAIAVSDAQRDPRFFAGISQRIGVPTRSVACAPAQRDGRVYGALQLINKKDGATFSADDMSVLDYLASQFADYVINTGQTDAS